MKILTLLPLLLTTQTADAWTCAENVEHWLYNQGLCGASNCYDENNVPLPKVIERECDDPVDIPMDWNALLQVVDFCEYNPAIGLNLPVYLWKRILKFHPSSEMHSRVYEICTAEY